jgi:hypothetical protein
MSLFLVCGLSAWLALRFGDRLPGSQLNLFPDPCEGADLEELGSAGRGTEQ